MKYILRIEIVKGVKEMSDVKVRPGEPEPAFWNLSIPGMDVREMLKYISRQDERAMGITAARLIKAEYQRRQNERTRQ